jgi:hypothetical protein
LRQFPESCGFRLGTVLPTVPTAPRPLPAECAGSSFRRAATSRLNRHCSSSLAASDLVSTTTDSTGLLSTAVRKSNLGSDGSSCIGSSSLGKKKPWQQQPRLQHPVRRTCIASTSPLHTAAAPRGSCTSFLARSTTSEPFQARLSDAGACLVGLSTTSSLVWASSRFAGGKVLYRALRRLFYIQSGRPIRSS